MKREWVSSPLKSAGIGHVHNLGFLAHPGPRPGPLTKLMCGRSTDRNLRSPGRALLAAHVRDEQSFRSTKRWLSLAAPAEPCPRKLALVRGSAMLTRSCLVRAAQAHPCPLSSPA